MGILQVAGRPKNTGNRQQVFNNLVTPHKEALFKKAIDMALNGNEAMLRLFLDRMLPAKPTNEPIQLDISNTSEFNNVRTITQLGSESLKAVLSGEITPEDAGRISAHLSGHYKTFELIELWEKFKALKRAWGAMERLWEASHKCYNAPQPPYPFPVVAAGGLMLLLASLVFPNSRSFCRRKSSLRRAFSSSSDATRSCN